jgi:hypothetical protein
MRRVEKFTVFLQKRSWVMELQLTPGEEQKET